MLGSFPTRKEHPLWFHIDYVFCPKLGQNESESVEVGEYKDWSKVSDHVPLTIDVNLES